MRIATVRTFAAAIIGLALVAVPVGADSLEAGLFLVADRQMLDPNFEKTVVLLIEHGERGALGLVVNRPSQRRLSALSTEFEGLQDRQDIIFTGGPVPGGRVFILIRGQLPPGADARPVVDDVYVAQDDAVLLPLTRMPGSEFRVYAGYAGWAPRQLEDEIDRGAWHVVPADADWIFSPHPAEIWERLAPPEASRQARLPSGTGPARILRR